MRNKSKFGNGESVIIIDTTSGHLFAIGAEVVINNITKKYSGYSITAEGIDKNGNNQWYFVNEKDIREKTEADLVQKCNKTAAELLTENSPVEEEKTYTREEVREICFDLFQEAYNDETFTNSKFNEWFDKNVK